MHVWGDGQALDIPLTPAHFSRVSTLDHRPMLFLRYASEHMSEPADYLGTKMMEDCIEYMATEEAQQGLKRKRNLPSSSSAATKAKAAKLLDMDSEESGDSEDEMQDRLSLEACSFVLQIPWSGLRVVT